MCGRLPLAGIMSGIAMAMPSITRLFGFLLVALGVVGYLATGRTSVTALIPAFVGAVFLLLAMAARNPNARRHVMHAAVALALLGVLGVVPRIVPAVSAGDLGRPAVLAQIAMALLLVIYIVLGVRSFIEARKARQ
jgi:hypothetical protein